MKKLLLTCATALLASATSFFAQSPQPTPNNQNDQVMRRALELEQMARQRRNAEFERNRDASDSVFYRRQRKQDDADFANVNDLYRKPSSEEMKILTPDQADVAKYSAFLKRSRTGLIRLAPDRGCSNDAYVVAASDECGAYTMPGGGTAYSFRRRVHTMERLADLRLSKGSFTAQGNLINGIMTDLGDVDIDSVRLDMPRLAFLAAFQPFTEAEQARKFSSDLAYGVSRGGVEYRSILPALSGHTYVLRSVAYNGKAYRTIGSSTYNELGYDKRGDVTVVFRIVRDDADGGVTLLWKELANRDAPKLKDVDPKSLN